MDPGPARSCKQAYSLLWLSPVVQGSCHVPKYVYQCPSKGIMDPEAPTLMFLEAFIDIAGKPRRPNDMVPKKRTLERAIVITD